MKDSNSNNTQSAINLLTRDNREEGTKNIRMTPAMARRVMKMLEREGIDTYTDTLTIDDLMEAMK